MAKVTGIDKIISNLQRLSADVRGNLNRQAVTAAAQIMKAEIEALAPVGRPEKRGKRKHYPLATHIVIEEVKRPRAYTQAEVDKVQNS